MVSVVIMLFSGIYLIKYYVWEPMQDKKDTAELIRIIGTDNGDDAKAKYPDIDFPDGIQNKYVDIYALNQDFIGWIKIDGTPINQPVVQTANNDDYLKISFNKDSTKYGCTFMDYRNNAKSLSKNTILYSHNMKDGQMFGYLLNFLNEQTFIQSPIIEYNTLYSDYKWKIYAAFMTNAEESGDRGYCFPYITTSFSSDDVFEEFISEVDQRKMYDTGVDIKPTDKILTLSTCNYTFDDARIVVMARLVRDGESAEVDVNNVKKNSSPRYPQAWYDANGMANPYRNAKQWKPIVD